MKREPSQLTCANTKKTKVRRTIGDIEDFNVQMEIHQ